MEPVIEFISTNWTSAVEVVLLAVLLYYGYLYFRGTPGAKKPLTMEEIMRQANEQLQKTRTTQAGAFGLRPSS